jgi:tetrahydromethanopterin S-methyltransferase subunit G
MSEIVGYELISDADVRATSEHIADLERQLSATRAELERYEDALEDIRQWADAYPTDIFPEPDFQRAHAVLTAAGMTLDAISAAVMRRAVDRVGKIASAALRAHEP